VASYRLRRSSAKLGRLARRKLQCVSSAAGSTEGSTLTPHAGRASGELVDAWGPNSARTTSRELGLTWGFVPPRSAAQPQFRRGRFQLWWRDVAATTGLPAGAPIPAPN
jgi:hypothetical protein